MKRLFLFLCFGGMAVLLVAQPRFSQPHGLYSQRSLTIAMEPTDAMAEIRYTTDGSEPTPTSLLYSEPLTVNRTVILRAAEVKDGQLSSSITTASYIFVSSVIGQSNSPQGYPDTWGSYTQIQGTAIADYEMDSEMTGNATLRPKIEAGLSQLPILSIVSDKDNFFSHENDPDRGGIYIFTGPPVGDPTGDGWTRPASAELIGGPQQHDLTVSCGVKLHGGHGRLAEKNPKHSFRLVFKAQYGPKSLKYPVFGKDEPQKFDQLVLRCHFGNAWQHWDGGNRQRAQYTRDVWARRMQRRISDIGINALYVHLFLNGMYWGIYNIAERVDDRYGSTYLGGQKEDIDVIKIEEEGGNHIEASEGTLDAWRLMAQTAARAADDKAYEQLDSLLDIGQFIDYMLINQYAGNTDWDHHNWYAVRRRGTDSQGFRFLCWDSEIIFENVNENNLTKNNGMESPTGIFHNLLQNPKFARQYRARAKELLAADGLLGEQSVVEVWDSLYHTIDKALYDEAARWGDYRRDVHPWQSRGQLYTVDDYYLPERNRLLYQYFPYRSETVLNSVLSFVDVDDFEAPADWVAFTASMFHRWNSTGADALVTEEHVNAEMNLNRSVGGGGVVAGFSSVSYDLFADVSQYSHIVLRGTGSGLRILANRLTDHGPYKQIVVSLNESDPYWNADLQAVVLPLADLSAAPTNQGVTRQDSFVHINAMKVENGRSVTLRGAYLIPLEQTGVHLAVSERRSDGRYYNLNGQEVRYPTRGIYVKNGKKYVIR